MSEPRRIGLIIPAIMERCRDMQLLHLLIKMKATDAARKQVITEFYEGGHIGGNEYAMLIEIYELEHA